MDGIKYKRFGGLYGSAERFFAVRTKLSVFSVFPDYT